MLAACGGTAEAIDMKWVGDCFITLSKVGLTVWQLDKSISRPFWTYKVCQLDSAFGFQLCGTNLVIGFKNGTIQTFDLRNLKLLAKE